MSLCTQNSYTRKNIVPFVSSNYLKFQLFFKIQNILLKFPSVPPSSAMCPPPLVGSAAATRIGCRQYVGIERGEAIIQCSAVQCSAVQCSAVQCSGHLRGDWSRMCYKLYLHSGRHKKKLIFEYWIEQCSEWPTLHYTSPHYWIGNMISRMAGVNLKSKYVSKYLTLEL